MANKEETRIERLERLTVQLFSRGHGAEVLQYWVDNYVMIENMQMDPAVEGVRAFVIRIHDEVHRVDEEEEEEKTDG